MSKLAKTTLSVAIAAAMAVLVITQMKGSSSKTHEATPLAPTTESAPTPQSQPITLPTVTLPRLVDLGSKTCIPCKKMAPILDGLKEDYAGRFEVEFIDVNNRANAEAIGTYRVEKIPTQVFLAGDGRELWRHEGFLDRDAILSKWKELGYEFEIVTPASASPTQPTTTQKE
jgi:thioredoxin 1